MQNYDTDAPSAARLYGAVIQLNRAERVHMNTYSQGDRVIERRFVSRLVATLGQEAWEKEKTAGSTMTLDGAIVLARSLADDPR